MAKKALLIGVSQYEAGLPPLAAAPKDVAAMLRVLQSSELGAFDEVKTLIDPDLEAMQTAIDLLFQSCQKGDLGLLYFSGHGITDDSDRLYLATRRTSKDTFRSTAVSASFIHGIMRDLGYQRQHVLILDCCYSGAFAEGWLAKSADINLKPQLEVEGSVVLTSSTSTQKSYEDKEGELSLYTNYIVQGIESGAAESDGDGMISADELHEYAKRHVQSAKPAMKPEIYGIRQGIKIRLARARVDTKLEYRRLVERYAENGKISFVGQDILEVQRERWGLSDGVAIAIENEVLEPVRKRLKNLERYEKSLERACKQQFPLTGRIIGQLKDLREVLGLRDEDVRAIQERVSLPYSKSRKQHELELEKQRLSSLEQQRQAELRKQQGLDLERQRLTELEQRRLRDAEQEKLKAEAKRQSARESDQQKIFKPRYEYAPLWKRLFAGMIDSSLIGIISRIFYEYWQPTAVPLWNFSLIFFYSYVVYSIGLESFFQGSVGKLILQLKVISNNGRGLFLLSIVRMIGKLITVPTFGIGLLMIFFTKHQQTLHDFISGTIVVKR